MLLHGWGGEHIEKTKKQKNMEVKLFCYKGQLKSKQYLLFIQIHKKKAIAIITVK